LKKQVEKTILALLLLLTGLMIAGGCEMNTNEADSYVPYEGLKLPTPMQQYIANDPTFGGSFTPGYFSWPEASAKGLYDEGTGLNVKYFYMQALYRKGLDAMLVEELDLDRYDREIGAQSTHFVPVDIMKEFNSDPESYFWSSLSMMNLDHIFLRNSVHVERLEGDDLQIFEDAYAERATEVSEEMREVIERTWKRIINTEADGSNEIYVYYSGIPRDDDPTSDTLVLQVWVGDYFAEDEIGEDGLELDEPFAEYKAGYNRARNKILPKMEKDFSKKIDLPVKIYWGDYRYPGK
jgi:hypothetical protein